MDTVINQLNRTYTTTQTEWVSNIPGMYKCTRQQVSVGKTRASLVTGLFERLHGGHSHQIVIPWVHHRNMRQMPLRRYQAIVMELFSNSVMVSDGFVFDLKMIATNSASG